MFKYLSIDKDGTAYECKTEPIHNGPGKWFTKEFFGSDDSMIKIDNPILENYEKVFDLRIKKQS